MAVLIALLVSARNNPPVAEARSVETREDTPKSITLTASDDDGDQLIYGVITTPAHGQLSGTPPELTYTPEANFSGSDSFTFKANDGEVDSDAATVSIRVEPVNDMPTANDDDVEAQEDEPIATVKVLANDTDPDGDKLVVVDATQGANGSVTIGTDSTLTYAPAKKWWSTPRREPTVLSLSAPTAL
ncbi:MAG: cadherin-like domain-containing protein [Planctomycetota bacterium]